MKRGKKLLILAAVLVVGDGAYLAFRGSTAHAQPVPSESGTLTQPARSSTPSTPRRSPTSPGPTTARP